MGISVFISWFLPGTVIMFTDKTSQRLAQSKILRNNCLSDSNDGEHYLKPYNCLQIISIWLEFLQAYNCLQVIIK